MATTSIAVIITLALFILGAFIPYWVTPKFGRFRKEISWGCLAMAVLLIPSLYYHWDDLQMLMIVAWFVLLILGLAGGKVKPPAPAPTAAPVDRMAELQRAAQLRDSGVLSEEEFQVEKRRLMGL